MSLTITTTSAPPSSAAPTRATDAAGAGSFDAALSAAVATDRRAGDRAPGSRREPDAPTDGAAPGVSTAASTSATAGAAGGTSDETGPDTAAMPDAPALVLAGLVPVTLTSTTVRPIPAAAEAAAPAAAAAETVGTTATTAGVVLPAGAVLPTGTAAGPTAADPSVAASTTADPIVIRPVTTTGQPSAAPADDVVTTVPAAPAAAASRTAASSAGPIATSDTAAAPATGAAAASSAATATATAPGTGAAASSAPVPAGPAGSTSTAAPATGAAGPAPAVAAAVVPTAPAAPATPTTDAATATPIVTAAEPTAGRGAQTGHGTEQQGSTAGDPGLPVGQPTRGGETPFVLSTTPTTAPAPAAATSTTPAPLGQQLARPVFSLAQAGPGEHVVTVQVVPDTLGPVTVRAHVTAHGMHVELFAASEAGRDAVRQVLPDLRRDASGTGLSTTLDLSSQNHPDESPDSDQRAGAGRPPADPGLEARAAPATQRTSAATPSTIRTAGLDVLA